MRIPISRPNGWLGDRRGTYRGLQRPLHCSPQKEWANQATSFLPGSC